MRICQCSKVHFCSRNHLSIHEVQCACQIYELLRCPIQFEEITCLPSRSKQSARGDRMCMRPASCLSLNVLITVIEMTIKSASIGGILVKRSTSGRHELRIVLKVNVNQRTSAQPSVRPGRPRKSLVLTSCSSSGTPLSQQNSVGLPRVDYRQSCSSWMHQTVTLE